MFKVTYTKYYTESEGEEYHERFFMMKEAAYAFVDASGTFGTTYSQDHGEYFTYRNVTQPISVE